MRGKGEKKGKKEKKKENSVLQVANRGSSTDHQLVLSWSARRSATPPAQFHETGRNHQRTCCVYSTYFSPDCLPFTAHAFSLQPILICLSIHPHPLTLLFFFSSSSFPLPLTLLPPTHSSSPHAHSPDCLLAVPAPTSPSVPPNPS